MGQRLTACINHRLKRKLAYKLTRARSPPPGHGVERRGGHVRGLAVRLANLARRGVAQLAAETRHKPRG